MTDVTGQAPNGTSAPAPQAPTLLPGVTLGTGLDNYAPMLTVTAGEKSGKSTTVITTLRGYPSPQHHPLVLAFDEFGPDACIRMGYQPHSIRIVRQPGNTWIEKARGVMRMLEQNKAQYQAQYGSVVVDCASTAAAAFHDDARNTPKNKNNPDVRAPYFEMALYFKEFVGRVIDFGLPSIWLAWLAEGGTSVEKEGDRKIERQELGGPDVMGRKLRNFLAGRAQHNLLLEKRKLGKGATDQFGIPVDDEGCSRLVHTQPWAMVNAGGRYSHLLPEPCPPNFSYVLGQITGRGPYARRG